MFEVCFEKRNSIAKLAVFKNDKVTWNSKMDDDPKNELDVSTNKLDLEKVFIHRI